ncbi:MAG: hypothetical protein LBS17_03300 [Actinomycetes bacterium]|jgi:hypothetical protein|nr:hypothetical protein [Actinomycetes bacterium]
MRTKTCPICAAKAVYDADVCYECYYRFDRASACDVAFDALPPVRMRSETAAAGCYTDKLQQSRDEKE